MVTPAGDVYCYHFNGVGSTVAMTDSTQDIVNKYAYDPFGNIASQSETVITSQPFKYVGQAGVMTEPNGFYYMKARYYDPTVGRFISEDPIGFNGGDTNLMAYVGNNPVTGVDPEGLCDMQDFANLSAGFGDGLLIFVGPYLRELLNINNVDQSSRAYTAGEVLSLLIGLARLGYALEAKLVSILASSGAEASLYRDLLKGVYRAGIAPDWRKPSNLGGLADDVLRYKAGKTNLKFNLLGAGIVGGRAGALNER